MAIRERDTSDPIPSRDAVRFQLQRLLVSDEFANAPSLRRFLDYVVDCTLRDTAKELKEYSIGVEVFNRSDSFDPRNDTIVRVQARRLRDKLAEYYRGTGREDSVVIEVPKGSYFPRFRSALKPQPVDAATRDRRASSLATSPPKSGHVRFEQGRPDRSHRGVIAAVRRPERHMVGRQEELAELRSGLEQVRFGPSLMIAAVGEAGIGKTTLVEAFLEEIDKDELCTVALGQCSERLAGTEAYLPILDVLSSLLQDDPQATSLMQQRAPWWYVQVGAVSAGDPADQHILDSVKYATQERVKRELVSFLQEMSALRPLLFFLEDLHWADVSTIDMLAYLGVKFDAMRLLIVTTYRPEEMALKDHPFLRIKSDLLSRGRCREIQLHFLKQGDIELYLSLKYPDHQLPPTFAELIHQQTEGSPLFVVDLVSDLEDRGVLTQGTGRWRAAQPISDLKMELPGSVKGMIARKIAELNEVDHRLMATASVQGFTFDSAVVARILGLDEEAAEERLQVLESDHRFVQLLEDREFPNGTFSLRYRFVHVLYQNELYASLTSTKRGRLSRAAAEALQDFYGERSSEVAAELAPLYETARDFSKAVEYFGVEAIQKSQVFAFSEAALLARRGLQLLERLPRSRERDRRELGLRITLGSAATAVFGYADKGVGQNYFAIRKLIDELGKVDREVILSTFGLHSYYLSTRDLEGALDLCAWYLNSGERRDDLVLLFFAHTILGCTLYFSGDFAPGLEHFEKAFSLYKPDLDKPLAFVSAQDVVLTAWNNYPWNLWLRGYPDQAIRCSAKAGQLAKKRSNPHVLTHRFVFGGFLFMSLRDVERTVEMSEANLAISEEHGFPWPLTLARLHKGWAIAQQGRREEGLALMHEGLDAFGVMGFETWTPIWYALMAEIYGQLDQIDKGLGLIADALNVTETSLDRIWEAELHRTKGDLLLLTGTTDTEVEGCYRKALEVARRQQSKSFELRAAMALSSLWLGQGSCSDAHALLSQVYGWFTEGFETRDLREAKALLDGMAHSD